VKTTTTYRLSAKEVAEAVCAYLRSKLTDKNEPIFSSHTVSFGGERRDGEYIFEYEVEERK
jgi:glycerol-3-phosphate dehydrogenase